MRHPHPHRRDLHRHDLHRHDLYRHDLHRELTLIFSLIGVVLAAVMARTAFRPRTTFTRTALTLTKPVWRALVSTPGGASEKATLLVAWVKQLTA